MSVPTIVLSNGVEIPQIGLGVFRMDDPEELDWAVKHAVYAGYRHFDTAAIYRNEEALGKALKESGIIREQLFITSKVWNNRQGYEETKRAFEETLERLGTDYLDLYLIHWHGYDVPGTWRALEELYDEKKVRAIGVSNFTIAHMEKLKESARILPMVNQVETHPYFPQDDLLQYLAGQGIAHEAWGPFSQGKSDLLLHPVLKQIGEKYDKTAAQVVLRWHLERGTIVIPKSTNGARIIENISVTDFELSREDHLEIATINIETRYGTDPDDKEFIEKTSRRK